MTKITEIKTTGADTALISHDQLNDLTAAFAQTFGAGLGLSPAALVDAGLIKPAAYQAAKASLTNQAAIKAFLSNDDNWIADNGHWQNTAAKGEAYAALTASGAGNNWLHDTLDTVLGLNLGYLESKLDEPRFAGLKAAYGTLSDKDKATLVGIAYHKGAEGALAYLKKQVPAENGSVTIRDMARETLSALTGADIAVTATVADIVGSYAPSSTGALSAKGLSAPDPVRVDPLPMGAIPPNPWNGIDTDVVIPGDLANMQPKGAGAESIHPIRLIHELNNLMNENNAIAAEIAERKQALANAKTQAEIDKITADDLRDLLARATRSDNTIKAKAPLANKLSQNPNGWQKTVLFAARLTPQEFGELYATSVVGSGKTLAAANGLAGDHTAAEARIKAADTAALAAQPAKDAKAALEAANKAANEAIGAWDELKQKATLAPKSYPGLTAQKAVVDAAITAINDAQKAALKAITDDNMTLAAAETGNVTSATETIKAATEALGSSVPNAASNKALPLMKIDHLGEMNITYDFSNNARTNADIRAHSGNLVSLDGDKLKISDWRYISNQEKAIGEELRAIEYGLNQPGAAVAELEGRVKTAGKALNRLNGYVAYADEFNEEDKVKLLQLNWRITGTDKDAKWKNKIAALNKTIGELNKAAEDAAAASSIDALAIDTRRLQSEMMTLLKKERTGPDYLTAARVPKSFLQDLADMKQDSTPAALWAAREEFYAGVRQNYGNGGKRVDGAPVDDKGDLKAPPEDKVIAFINGKGRKLQDHQQLLFELYTTYLAENIRAKIKAAPPKDFDATAQQENFYQAVKTAYLAKDRFPANGGEKAESPFAAILGGRKSPTADAGDGDSKGYARFVKLQPEPEDPPGPEDPKAAKSKDAEHTFTSTFPDLKEANPEMVLHDLPNVFDPTHGWPEKPLNPVEKKMDTNHDGTVDAKERVDYAANNPQ